MNVTVVVATCGNDEWLEMGNKAADSIYIPGIVRIHLPKGTVSEARNKGLSKVKTEYVCFVDADDTLKHGYFGFEPTEDVTVTSIRYKNKGEPQIPKVWAHEVYGKKQHNYACHGDCLIDGNYIHIGAIVKTKLAKEIGGFHEYPVYEDWDFWLRLQQHGATFGQYPESIYEASVRENNNHRNQSMPKSERNKIHEQIYEDVTGKKWSKLV